MRPVRNRKPGKVFYFLIGTIALASAMGCPAERTAWRDTFPVDKSNLVPSGTNTFFTLQPGAQSTLSDGEVTLTITVLDETKVVDEVETRVIEEREERGGQPLEISRNYFAIDRISSDVYYFGEDVDIYDNGQVISHAGEWLAGVQGARFGLIMPGTVVAEDRYYQEIAPGVALDRAEHVAIDETVETPAGTFRDCLHVLETTPLERGTSDKWYCPGVGLVRDDDFSLIRASEPQPRAGVHSQGP